MLTDSSLFVERCKNKSIVDAETALSLGFRYFCTVLYIL